jgi:5-formyltetrahydrofolate cyclo-ligase
VTDGSLTDHAADLRAAKRAFRREALARRDAMLAGERAAASLRIAARLAAIPPYRAAKRIALFASMRSEVDTTPLLEAALAGGTEVFLPVTDLAAHALRFHAVGAIADLVTGPYGIREPDPRGAPPADPATFDLVVVPGAAFDEAGGRIGYGGGFYDAVLARVGESATVVAPAFDVQVVDSVPREPHDRRVGWIVTESRTVRCR